MPIIARLMVPIVAGLTLATNSDRLTLSPVNGQRAESTLSTIGVRVMSCLQFKQWSKLEQYCSQSLVFSEYRRIYESDLPATEWPDSGLFFLGSESKNIDRFYSVSLELRVGRDRHAVHKLWEKFAGYIQQDIRLHGSLDSVRVRYAFLSEMPYIKGYMYLGQLASNQQFAVLFAKESGIWRIRSFVFASH